MLVTHWIAGTACTSWSDRASLAPETGRKRHLQRIKKAKQGRRETRTRVKPSTRVFCPTPIAPKTQNPRPHPRRPGTGPTSAPTSARDPLNTLFRISRTYSKSPILRRNAKSVSGTRRASTKGPRADVGGRREGAYRHCAHGMLPFAHGFDDKRNRLFNGVCWKVGRPLAQLAC